MATFGRHHASALANRVKQKKKGKPLYRKALRRKRYVHTPKKNALIFKIFMTLKGMKNDPSY